MTEQQINNYIEISQQYHGDKIFQRMTGKIDIISAFIERENCKNDFTDLDEVREVALGEEL